MSSQAGAHNTLKLAPSAALFPQHNNDTATPGLPVKAAIKIYAGCMVAYDPALSQCQFADPAMPSTARVIGVSNETLDNSLGAKGDIKARPEAGVWRLKSDGNLTAAHAYTPCRVVDDHTVGVLAGTDADRIAGLFIGLEVGTGYAWVLILPETAQRAPVSLAQASATLTGTLTGTVNGALVDVAASAGACAGGSSPTATQVDTAIATAVATIVTGTNEQLKEIQALLNKISAALVTHNIVAPSA